MAGKALKPEEAGQALGLIEARAGHGLVKTGWARGWANAEPGAEVGTCATGPAQLSLLSSPAWPAGTLLFSTEKGTQTPTSPDKVYPAGERLRLRNDLSSPGHGILLCSVDKDADGKVKASQLGAEWTAGQVRRTAL